MLPSKDDSVEALSDDMVEISIPTGRSIPNKSYCMLTFIEQIILIPS